MTNTPGPSAPSPPPAPARAPLTLRLGDPLIVLGALAIFGFSFAPFVRYSDEAEQTLVIALLGIRSWFNAWALETFMAPLTSFVVLAALLNLALALTRFLLRREPSVLGFRLRQIEVGLAMFSFFVLLGMVASEKHVVFGARRLGEADPTFNANELALATGWGAVLMLVAAIITLTGVMLNHLSLGPQVRLSGHTADPTGAWPGGQQAPPGPGYGQPQDPGYGTPPSRGTGGPPRPEDPPAHSP